MDKSLYRAHGIQFRYPSEWEVNEQEGEQELTVSVQSPGTSFWSISLYSERPRPRRVIESAVEAFQDEYAEVDHYPVESHLGQRPNVAEDLDFVCFDMISSAYLRAFETDRCTVLVLYQGDDQELDATRPLLEDIGRSLICTEDPLGLPG